MKNKLLALLLSVCTIPAFADVSGSLGYTSDYVWRGVLRVEEAVLCK